MITEKRKFERKFERKKERRERACIEEEHFQNHLFFENRGGTKERKKRNMTGVKGFERERWRNQQSGAELNSHTGDLVDKMRVRHAHFLEQRVAVDDVPEVQLVPVIISHKYEATQRCPIKRYQNRNQKPNTVNEQERKQKKSGEK